MCAIPYETMLDALAEQTITRELGAAERLLWSGRPRQGIVFRGSDAFMIPFSLLWCGFVIYWEFSVLKHGAPWVFMLWGLLFLAIGLYFVFGRFVVDKRLRGKTVYAVSNERVIIVSGQFNRKVKSLNLRTLTDISLTERSDHSGTINFGATNPMLSWFGGMWWPGMEQYNEPKFELVPNAKDVYEMIRKAQRNAT